MLPQWIIPVVSFYYPIFSPGFSLPDPTPQQIQLVQQLGSEKYAEREAAEEKLAKMDSEAYKALYEGVTKSPDPEIRSRCNRILPRVMRYNVPKDTKDLPTLFGVYRLKVKFKSGREFSIEKESFRKYYWRAIMKSNDSWKNRAEGNLQYMTYLLPEASHEMFVEMRLLGYSRADIDELMTAMNKNLKKMRNNNVYDYYQWLRD